MIVSSIHVCDVCNDRNNTPLCCRGRVFGSSMPELAMGVLQRCTCVYQLVVIVRGAQNLSNERWALFFTYFFSLCS